MAPGTTDKSDEVLKDFFGPADPKLLNMAESFKSVTDSFPWIPKFALDTLVPPIDSDLVNRTLANEVEEFTIRQILNRNRNYERISGALAQDTVTFHLTDSAGINSYWKRANHDNHDLLRDTVYLGAYRVFRPGFSPDSSKAVVPYIVNGILVFSILKKESKWVEEKTIPTAIP